MTPDQLSAKIAAKNTKNVVGGVLLLLLAAILWPITYVVAWFLSSWFWFCIATVREQSVLDYDRAIFLTSLVVFVLFTLYGIFRANADFDDEYFERASLSGHGFAAMYFFGGMTTRLAIVWIVAMCAPIFTQMGIHQIRTRLPSGPFTLDVAARLYNEMDADQCWRPLPEKEPHRTAAMLLAKLELIRCSPDRRGGFNIRVPSKKKSFL